MTESNPGYDKASYVRAQTAQKSLFQSDDRIFHREGARYASVQSVSEIQASPRRVACGLTHDDGTRSRFVLLPVAPGVLRFQLGREGASFPERSEMLSHPLGSPGKFTTRTTRRGWQIRFGKHKLILGRDPFALRIEGPGGEKVFELETEAIGSAYLAPPLGFRGPSEREEAYLSFHIQHPESFFGFGEKFCKVEKTSTRATIWAADTCGTNTTDLSYKSVPLLFSTRGFGLMLHSAYRSHWEIATFSYTSGSFLVEEGRLDGFLLLADSLKELIGLYTELTGKPLVPPAWSLGVWMSRCAYQNRAEVTAVLDRLRAEDIPCDVIHLDPPWMAQQYYQKLGVDACDFVWAEDRFPDRVGMFREFLQKGFNTCLWINPYLPGGEPIYEEAQVKGYLVRDEAGEVARLEYGQNAGVVDLTHPGALSWWKDKLRALIQDGASVLKPDYGDRVSESSRFFDGRSGREMHNLYLHLYSKAAFDVVAEVRGEGIVWRRAGYLGSQRYPGTWAGDTQVSWEGLRCCLRGGLSAGFAGEAFWSNDIGGFCGPKPTEELYIRWAQFGLLTPFARFHGTTPREPWEYGPRALSIVRRQAKLRYGLIPYYLALAEEAHRTGLPILRHLKLEFESDPLVDGIDDQFLIGSDLLIAPVLVEGARDRQVYFPRATWYALQNGQVVPAQGICRTIAAPLTRTPLFVREGAVIPRWEKPPRHLKQPDLGRKLWVDIYAGPTQKKLEWTLQGRRIVLDYQLKRGLGRLTIEADELELGIGFIGFSGWQAGRGLTGAERPVREAGKIHLRCQVRGRRTLTFRA